MSHLGPELHQTFDKFSKLPRLQDTVLEWLATSECGSSTDEATIIIRERLSNAHHKLLQGLIDQLSVEKKQIITHAYDWIKYAAEPLTPEILVEAIRCSVPQQTAHLQLTQSHEEFRRFMEQTLRGVILRDGRDIKFSDDAFYETSMTDDVNDGQELTCRSHASMATACLRYLLRREGQKMLASLSVESQGMDNPTWSPIKLPRHSLVSYALRFWTVHYQAADDYRPTHLATELLQNKSKRVAWAEAIYVISNPFTRSNKGYISPLPYMSMLGLDNLVLRQIEGETRHDGSNQDYWLAIAEAARNGHGSTVALLLEYTDTDVAGLGEALHWAASYGEGGALDCLVSKAQELKQYPWPPFILERAVVAGLENLVSALVETGYDLNEESSTGEGSAVHTAIKYGQDCVLKILLDSGRVDLGLQDGREESTWVLAVKAGNTASIQHMLDAGASLDDFDVAADVLLWTVCWGSYEALRMLIDAKVFSEAHIRSQATTTGSEYTYPLEIASSRGYKACTRILLDNGADPNAVSDSKYGSALCQVIVYTQDDPICLMLLEKGAHPNRSAADDPAYESSEMVLMQAISTGKQSLVDMLLDYGAEMNVADPSRTEYDTPLSWAIECGHSHIANLLLERGADPNLASEEKGCWSPLFNACFLRSDITLIESLIKRGANVQWTRGEAETLWSRSDGWSVLHAAYDSPKTLSMLLENGADINVTDKRNWTVLMLAVANKEIESIRVLLKQKSPKADLEVMSTDKLTETALHLASRIGYAEPAKLLLEAGADVNCQRNDGMIPISLVLESVESHVWDVECEDIVTLMLQRRPDLSLSDSLGDTVLHKIKANMPVSVVKRLVEGYAPVDTVNGMGFTPLAWAVRFGNYDVARYLTTLKGVRSDFYDKDFGSLLHLAARLCNLDMVEQLVRTGADHSVVHPEFGASVLDSAIQNSDEDDRKEIIEYLVEKVGVDVNARGGEWGCPLMLVVAGHGHKSSIDESFLLEYLLRHGARTDYADSLGRTIAHWAVMKLSVDEVRMVSKFGGDFTSVDNYGRTPLHFAASICDLDVLRFVLKENVSPAVDSSNVDFPDADGWTALMWACKSSTNAQASLLVKDYGANICVCSNDGEWSPLKLARLCGWLPEDLEFLVPAPASDAQGREEDQATKDREAMNESFRSVNCSGCVKVCDANPFVDILHMKFQ